ncbi:hypothetical protein [Streptomyces parvulus]|uniref:hypothetical protein n=1 Tax=Streptomyces parvulus TaxID=146923 RepID=UPI0037B1D3B8
MDTTQRQQQIRATLASITLVQAKEALEAVLNVAESAEQKPDNADRTRHADLPDQHDRWLVGAAGP